MGDRRWGWELTSGASITASVDDEGIESVRLGPRLVSRSPKGGKPDGHVVELPATEVLARDVTPERDVLVMFHPEAGTCLLTVAGEPIPPVTEPPPLAPRRSMPWPTVIVALVGLVVIGAALAGITRWRRMRLAADQTLSSTHRTPSFVAHFPASFVVEDTRDDESAEIVRAGRDEVVFIASATVPPATDIDAVADAAHAAMEERSSLWASVSDTTRSKDTCAGEQGVVLEGALRAGFEHGRLWSCVVVRGARAYVFLTGVPIVTPPTWQSCARSSTPLSSSTILRQYPSSSPRRPPRPSARSRSTAPPVAASRSPAHRVGRTGSRPQRRRIDPLPPSRVKRPHPR